MSTMFWKGRRLIVALQEFQSVFREDPEILENMEDLEIIPWGAWEIVPWGSGRHPWETMPWGLGDIHGRSCHGGLEDIHGRLCQGVHGGHPLETMPRVMEDILWTLCQGGHGGHPLDPMPGGSRRTSSGDHHMAIRGGFHGRLSLEDVVGGERGKFGRPYGLLPV